MSDWAPRDVPGHVTSGHHPSHPARTVHVIPCGDTITHDPDDDCICGPAQVPLTHPDGTPCGWLAIHARLDPPTATTHAHLYEG